MKNIVIMLVGVVIGFSTVTGFTYEKPVSETKDEQVVLGHRVGPHGQIMLVTKH